MSESKEQVTNPIQGCSDIFYRPSEVFQALSVRENWSWIPFLLVVTITTLPAYMYFGAIDFSWYVDSQIALSTPDASPAEKENMRPFYGTAERTAMFTLIAAPLYLIVVSAVMAFYYTAVTRNDEKSIHSYFDWYGAQWWFYLPTLIVSVISLSIILFLEPGAQVSQAVLSPSSLAFILSIDQDSKWMNFLSGLRLEQIWTIYLGGVCLQQWTTFSAKKSYIFAAIPTVAILSLVLIWTLAT